MKIPVILLNYNSTEDCRKCISYLHRQEGVELEIIVVDNSSAPDNREAVEALCHECGCTFIPNDRNAGYNAGNNIGLRYAASKGYEYALISNPDMEFPQKNYVTGLVDVISRNDDIVIVASDIVTPKGIHQNPMKPEGNWTSSFGWVTGLFRKQPKDTYSFIDNWQDSHWCRKVSGCCFLIRMSFIVKIGFFDENVFLYCEEAVLSKQIEYAGNGMFYTADMQAVHNHRPLQKSGSSLRFKMWYSSRKYYIEKYSGFSYYGKWMAIISMKLYTILLIFGMNIKNGR